MLIVIGNLWIKGLYYSKIWHKLWISRTEKVQYGRYPVTMATVCLKNVLLWFLSLTWSNRLICQKWAISETCRGQPICSIIGFYRESILSSSAVNLLQFFLELCPFWDLEYLKYTVFHTFLLHALTYWADNLHITLFYCTTEHVWVSSISVNFCGSYAPFGTYNTGNTQFSSHFYTCFDILSWNSAYDFVLLYYRLSLSAVNLLQFLLELCPFWNLEYWKYTVFHTFLIHALTYWAEILNNYDFVVLYYRSS